jgi:hypothetical protein
MKSAQTLTMARRTGAVAILATGAVHLEQLMVEDFQGIPAIQVLFPLNVIASGVTGVCLLAPLDRVLPDQWMDGARALLAGLGLTIAVGSLVGLFVVETVGIFGLRTHHYSAAAVLAIVVEGTAALSLTPVLASGLRGALRHR